MQRRIMASLAVAGKSAAGAALPGLSKRNSMDTPWGQGKHAIAANKPHTAINESIARFLAHRNGPAGREASQTCGVLVEDFWPRAIPSKFPRTCSVPVPRVPVQPSLNRPKLLARP